jgi:Uma2 family endonuclease
MTTTIAPSSSVDQRVVLHDISWETYESLLRELEGQQLRLTYDRGELEIMTPSPRHGKIGLLIARLIETYTLELHVPLVGLSNTTWRRESLEKGIEADECYYLANATWAAGREEFDLDVDPPPDLAIEVDISRSSLDKQSIYAALGVPELWRYEDDQLSIVQLDTQGHYQPSQASPSLPHLPPKVIERFVRLRTSGKTDTEIIAAFVEWIHEQPGHGRSSSSPSP